MRTEAPAEEAATNPSVAPGILDPLLAVDELPAYLRTPVKTLCGWR